MSTVETRIICTVCDRRETRVSARFCGSCGAILPGFSQVHRSERFFADGRGTKPLALSRDYLRRPMDRARAMQLFPDPAPLPLPSPRTIWREWMDIPFGWVGLLALMTAGAGAWVAGNTRNVLLFAIGLLLGRYAVHGGRRTR